MLEMWISVNLLIFNVGTELNMRNTLEEKQDISESWGGLLPTGICLE